MGQRRTPFRFRDSFLRSFTGLAALACATACGQPPAESPASSSAPPAAEPSADPAAAGVIDRRGKGGASVFVAHQVSDFEAFKKFLEDGAPEREKAGVVGHLLTRLDDGKVVIHFFASDLDALKMTLESPALKEYLNRSGAPDASLVWLSHDLLVKMYPKPPAMQTFSLYLRMRVVDLAAVRNGFVKLQPVFDEQSAVASSLHRSVDQADLVFLHVVGTNKDQLAKLAARPEFQEWIKSGGSPEAPQTFLGEDLSRSRSYYSNFQ